jgi:hypothetical protein
MKLEYLSTSAQDGLRAWSLAIHHDELLFDGIASSTKDWAWMWFQLREAEDKPDWFPKGKWATLQVIESILINEYTGRESMKIPLEEWSMKYRCSLINPYKGQCTLAMYHEEADHVFDPRLRLSHHRSFCSASPFLASPFS